MENNELISIVITTHKRSDRIGFAIESAINQTYHNTEVIVVDDNASIVGEREKTEKIVGKYKNVKFIKNTQNLGGAESRNVGARAARGKLISFLDDDDQYLPDRIEKLYRLYCKNKSKKLGLIYCSCFAVNERGDILGEYIHTESGMPIYEQMMGCVAGTSMWLIPKEALTDVGGFDLVPSKQDSTVILKLLVAGYCIVGTSDRLVLYLEHDKNDKASSISGIKPSNIEGILEYRELCRRYYDMLKNEKQVDDVECNFSRQLVTLYIANKKRKNAIAELNNILRRRPFCKAAITSIMKVVFSNLYRKRLGVK